MPAKKRTVKASGFPRALPEIPMMPQSELWATLEESDPNLLKQSAEHDRENYNPFSYRPWWYTAGDIERPAWTNSHVCWSTEGVTRKSLRWRASVWSSSNGGRMGVESTTHFAGKDDFPSPLGSIPTAPCPRPKQDGLLEATWDKNGKVLIRVGLNQQRLLARKWKLSENYEAVAVDLSDWTPEFEPPGKKERELLELQVLSQRFLMKQYLKPGDKGKNAQSVGKKHDGYRAKFDQLRDREFVAQSRNLQDPIWENHFIMALGAAFADNVEMCKLAPPTQAEVKWKMAEMFPKYAHGKTDGSWSAIFNRMGFGWL